MARLFFSRVFILAMILMTTFFLKKQPGRNKLLINHLGKLFVTSDAATIIREIEVVHPAAKLLVMASQAQESEVCVVIDL
jgi:TCP-1/cpn60 chaperonin family